MSIKIYGINNVVLSATDTNDSSIIKRLEDNEYYCKGYYHNPINGNDTIDIWMELNDKDKTFRYSLKKREHLHEVDGKIKVGYGNTIPESSGMFVNGGNFNYVIYAAVLARVVGRDRKMLDNNYYRAVETSMINLQKQIKNSVADPRVNNITSYELIQMLTNKVNADLSMFSLTGEVFDIETKHIDGDPIEYIYDKIGRSRDPLKISLFYDIITRTGVDKRTIKHLAENLYYELNPYLSSEGEPLAQY